MPRGDGTGPLGNGSLTGRGLGPCGRGLAFRRGFFGRDVVRRYPSSATLSKDEEKKILEEELKELETEKQEIEKRLKEF